MPRCSCPYAGTTRIRFEGLPRPDHACSRIDRAGGVSAPCRGTPWMGQLSPEYPRAVKVSNKQLATASMCRDSQPYPARSQNSEPKCFDEYDRYRLVTCSEHLQKEVRLYNYAEHATFVVVTTSARLHSNVLTYHNI